MSATHKIRPEDVVVGLLAEVLEGTNSHRFVADPVSVHTHFFEWRDRHEFSGLLGDFVFDSRDYYPYSETLDRVLDGLQLAGYLERTNPQGTWYEITPALRTLFERDIKSRFDEPALRALVALAREFVKGIETNRRVPA
jgi:hypothetical protein